jgi:hypothetical protein
MTAHCSNSTKPPAEQPEEPRPDAGQRAWHLTPQEQQVFHKALRRSVKPVPVSDSRLPAVAGGWGYL